ncbi:cytochrome P450 [Aspergillus ellipticus CBS 707.79]|uniref:Cytochrome P450 n=1 Tax=Aspergillus ellipticus CBS 707.79 TaxID=1448320 RepID=A0A319D7X4_9EURO|nr:cytochrome P450 [Aspergillus ellipticus CBS 707.79]
MDAILDPRCLTAFLLGSAVLGLLGFIYLTFFYVDYPKVKGILEIPGGELIAGHLYQLEDDHATTTERWAKQFHWPVFQIRMGNRRAVILNSFEAAREWLVKNQSATLDRPSFYTFHKVVSATSAATIGTSPWDERTKKQRRVVGSLTTGPSIQKLRSMLDLETFDMISGLYYNSQNGTADIMPHFYQKRVALNVMMMFCYGTRFSSITDLLLLQILEDASTIASFRSTNSNPQDFIPHLRYFGKGGRTATALEVRQRRDTWLAAMLDRVRDTLPFRTGEKKCVAEMLLTYSQEGLTQLDVKTILGGLMSGGFEALFSTAIIAIGMLSTLEGQEMQVQAYADIMSAYSTPEEAFEHCVAEEKCAHISALVKETLRFYPPLKLLPARQTYKDFTYRGAAVPKGLLVYVNTQAAGRDKAIYGPDADRFLPERWLKSEHEIPAPYHFAFGAGSRMCTAVNFSNRVLYAIFLRLIVSFKMVESELLPPNTHYIDYKRDQTASNAIPSDFKVRFVPRDEGALERCLERSREMCAGIMSETGKAGRG